MSTRSNFLVRKRRLDRGRRFGTKPTSAEIKQDIVYNNKRRKKNKITKLSRRKNRG